MARRIDEDNHPEILLQVELYGWLYEKTCGTAPLRLQVHSGTGEIVEVPYDGGQRVLQELERALALKQLQSEPYEPVGWSKCLGCGYTDRCWTMAEQKCDVSRVCGVDQSLARALRAGGICTFKDLLDQYDVDKLAEFKRPWGKKEQRVGKSAAMILRFAEAMRTGKEEILAVPAILDAPNYVMFDLEGMPPYLQELDKIYLWGTQVFGEQPSEFMFAVARLGPDGDKEAWFAFLSNAKKIFERYGDTPWVHWSPYERDKIKKYAGRYGDVDNVAGRVIKNLLDLLEITRDSMVLPLPSLSLKVVEDYVGFERKEDEYGGTWAMATFIEATETNDEGERKQLIDRILSYNREDLEATWAVFQWLRTKRPGSQEPS